MNPQINFYYPHSDYSCLPIDKRKTSSQAMVLEHFYYAVYRVEVDFDTIYRHTLIIADDFDQIILGLEESINRIKHQFKPIFPPEISLVLLRSLKMIEPEFLKTLKKNGIQTEVATILSKRNDDHYTAVGMADDQLELFPLNATDGLAAIRVARLKFAKILGTYFSPIEVCQAHPVMEELNVKFQIVAKRISLLINCEETCFNSLH